MKHSKTSAPLNISTPNNDLVEIIFRDRMKYLSLLSSAVVHELHTPLVIIRGLAESLLRSSAQNSNANLKEIAKESENILKILEAMAFVSTSVDKIKLQNLSLKELVDQAVIFFEQKCLEKGISLRLEIEDHLRIETEPNRLKSILIAVMNNAIESFNNLPADKIRSISIHSQNDKKNLHLIIADTGTGMCADLQDRVLKGMPLDFTDKQQVTGLGLALAQKMALDLKIELSFFSEETKGTSFTLSFPQNIHTIT